MCHNRLQINNFYLDKMGKSNIFNSLRMYLINGLNNNTK